MAPVWKLHQEDIKHLRHMWESGIASGPAGELDMEKLRGDARERLEGATASCINVTTTQCPSS